jgi:hypothetical protein
VILLDTDHVNVLKYPEHPRFASLTTQLNTSDDQDIATTVITDANVPELVNLQNVNGQAKPYQVKQLLRLIERYNLQIEEGP